MQNACERYGAVIENYRAGRYPKHEGFTDDFFHGAAELMDVLNRRREVQQQIVASLQLNKLLERRRELQKQLLSTVQTNVGGLRTELQDEARRVNEQLAAFYRQLERFY